MKISKHDLEIRFEELYGMYRDKIYPKDSTEYKEILYDLMSLKKLLSLKGIETPCIEEPIMQIDDNEINMYLSENSTNIVKGLTCYNSVRLPFRLTFNGKIGEKEYIELVRDFFSGFDKTLLKGFNFLERSGNIELTTKNSEARVNGICYKIFRDNSCYITSTFNNKFSSMPTLPHEIAHYEQTRGMFNYNMYTKYLNSIFRESYPIFVSYAFIDYIKQNYPKQGINLEYNNIDNFLAEIDLAFTNGHYNKSTLTNLFDKLLAMNLLSVYRLCPTEAIELAKHYDDIFAKGNDLSIIEDIGLDTLLDSGKPIINSFIRTLK